MRLCYSRMQLVQIFPRESHEMVFEEHKRAFLLAEPTAGKDCASEALTEQKRRGTVVHLSPHVGMHDVPDARHNRAHPPED